jgi:hypothetical protein
VGVLVRVGFGNSVRVDIVLIVGKLLGELIGVSVASGVSVRVEGGKHIFKSFPIFLVQ